MPGMRFGHAGTIVEGKADTAAEKIARLRTPASRWPRRSPRSPGSSSSGWGGGVSRADAARHVHRRRGRRPVRARRRAGEASSRRPARSTSSPPATAACEIVDENLDECVLCELCLDAAPQGAVRVIKLYDGGAALERPPAGSAAELLLSARQLALDDVAEQLGHGGVPRHPHVAVLVGLDPLAQACPRPRAR